MLQVFLAGAAGAAIPMARKRLRVGFVSNGVGRRAPSQASLLARRAR